MAIRAVLEIFRQTGLVPAAQASFQYPVHNSKSLIAMLSHKNTVHIVATKGIFGK
jgi:hypothetical protein